MFAAHRAAEERQLLFALGPIEPQSGRQHHRARQTVAHSTFSPQRRGHPVR